MIDVRTAESDVRGELADEKLARAVVVGAFAEYLFSQLEERERAFCAAQIPQVVETIRTMRAPLLVRSAPTLVKP